MKKYKAALALLTAVSLICGTAVTSYADSADNTKYFSYVDELAGIQFSSIDTLGNYIAEISGKKKITGVEKEVSDWLLSTEGVYLPANLAADDVTGIIITPTYVCALFEKNGKKLEFTQYTDPIAGERYLNVTDFETEVTEEDIYTGSNNDHTVYFDTDLSYSIYAWEQEGIVFKLREYSGTALDTALLDLCDARLYPLKEDKNGWQVIDGEKYYYKNGKPVTKSTEIDGIRYKFTSDGVCKGKFSGSTKSSKGRRFYKNGLPLTDKWIKLKNGEIYYAGRDGYARTGWAAVAKDKGFYSYFDENGVWDGKTYWTGYQPDNLYSFFLDFDLLSDTALACGYTKSGIAVKSPSAFTDNDLLKAVLEKDMYTPALKDSISDDEAELNDALYHGGKCIKIISSADSHAYLEFTKDSDGNSYLYNGYFGFGLKLSDKKAYDKLAEAVEG